MRLRLKVRMKEGRDSGIVKEPEWELQFRFVRIEGVQGRMLKKTRGVK